MPHRFTCPAHTRTHPFACSLLYELFTSAAAVDKGAPLLIVCNKMDAPGARTIDAVKAILEEEL